MNKIILAYSGGLDTSVILKWLLDKGYEVICFIADVGQQEDFQKVKKKALNLGASKVTIKNLKSEFLEKFIFPALQANAKYERKYLLGTALARPLIGKELAAIAKKEKTTLFAHGATGKGNDQVRFELAIYQQFSNANIIAPWRDPEFYERFEGRSALIKYAKENAIPISCSLKKPYSIDENLMHASYEGGPLEDPSAPPKNDMFQLTVSPEDAPDEITQISITFEKGIPILLELPDAKITDSLKIFQTLQKIAGENGIGRTDIVESRIVGMKSRGVYESPAATVLWLAHADLENLTLSGEVLKLKFLLEPLVSDLIYKGLWFTPEMDCLMASIQVMQQYVNGTVHLSLYKGHCQVTGRESKNTLYNSLLCSMDKLGSYDQSDAAGFIKTLSLRLTSH